jgi:hypothetical protein
LRGGKPYLEAGFTLRCFQRLSLPNSATQRCPWQDNWYTGGSFSQVLSYYGQLLSSFLRTREIETVTLLLPHHAAWVLTSEEAARMFPPSSACCHAGRTISSAPCRWGAWRIVSEDPAGRVRPAVSCGLSSRLSRTGRSFPHTAKFIDSRFRSLSHDVLNPAHVPL